MVEIPRRARRTSTLMPPYHAVLAVDAEKYTRATSRNQQILSNTVRGALEQAFEASGLADQWRNASFPQTTGDGYLVGIPPEYLPLLIHPLLGELQNVLSDMQPGLAYEDRELRLRLRAAIGIGPLPDSGGAEYGDGVGDAMNETHRVLDSPAVREALGRSNPDVTFLVAGLTGRAYDDAVLGGYVAVSQRLFYAVTAELPEKGFRAEAFLYIPQPSGWQPEAATKPKAAASGEKDAAPAQPPAEDSGSHAAPAPVAANSASGVSGAVVQGAQAGGDIQIGDRTSIGTQHVGGIGGVTGDVGTIVTGTEGPVHTGSGNQVNQAREGQTPVRDAEAVPARDDDHGGKA